MNEKSMGAVGSLFMLLVPLGCGEDGEGATLAGAGSGGASQTAAGAGGSNAGAGMMSGGGAGTAGSEARECRSEADVTTASNDAEGACRAFCEVEVDCDSRTDVDDCLAYRRCDRENQGSAGCVAAAKVYWDCLRAQVGPQLCDDPERCCDAQGMATGDACAGG